MRSHQFLLYGAYGYTGTLITELAKEYQLKPILAGRKETMLQALSEKHKLSYKTLDLSDTDSLHEALIDVVVVLHAAGPFRYTAKQMIAACIKSKTHYLDITGEIEVFEMAKSFDMEAREAGIMIMPGAGFDVVPTDCLALFLKNKLPAAHTLKLAFTTRGASISHGTAMTMVEGLGAGGAIRENGIILHKPLGHKGRWIDFGSNKLFAMTIPWGDVSTAFHTTGIKNIETYTAIKPGLFRMLKLQWLYNWLLKKNTVKAFIKKHIERRPAGPSSEERKQAKSLVWGEVKDIEGNVQTARLETPDGYTFTAHSSLIIVNNILRGDFKTGYQTPASAYGPDLVLKVTGTKRTPHN